MLHLGKSSETRPPLARNHELGSNIYFLDTVCVEGHYIEVVGRRLKGAKDTITMQANYRKKKKSVEVRCKNESSGNNNKDSAIPNLFRRNCTQRSTKWWEDQVDNAQVCSVSDMNGNQTTTSTKYNERLKKCYTREASGVLTDKVDNYWERQCQIEVNCIDILIIQEATSSILQCAKKFVWLYMRGLT